MAGKTGGKKERVAVSIAAMLLVTLRDEAQVIDELARRGYKGNKKVAEILAEARERIILSGDVDRRRELADMIARRRIYIEENRKSIEEAEKLADKTAAIRLGKDLDDSFADLLDLRNSLDRGVVEENVESEQLRYVRGHIEALGVAEEGLPLEELARQVAAAYAALRADREAGGAPAPEAGAGGAGAGGAGAGGAGAGGAGAGGAGAGGGGAGSGGAGSGGTGGGGRGPGIGT